MRKLEAFEPREWHPSADKAAPKLIYIICDERDREAAIPLRKFLKAQGFESRIPVFAGDANTVRVANQEALLECDATIVFYGAGDEAWKRTIDNELRKVKGYRPDKPLPPVGLFLSGPETTDKKELLELESNPFDGMQGFSETAKQPLLRYASAGQMTPGDYANTVSRNPFPGLRPFRDDEEHLFFGRERQIDRMVDKLCPVRFLAIVGTSGSGKSSLVNCGLRPALHRGLMTPAGTAWKIAQFRPGNKPLRAMARALAEPNVLFPQEEKPLGGLPLDQIIEATLRISALGLADIYDQAYPAADVNLLVVVDQFEELFRYQRLTGNRTADQYGLNEEVTAFVSLLLEASAQRNFPIYVVLTMRSDFLGDCAQFDGLPEAINEGQYLVPRMSRAERRSAIEGPVAVGGGTISPVLLTRLVNDVGDNPDQLSILQHAVNRTWARCRVDPAAGGELLPGHYEDIGSMVHALDRHAEKAFAELITSRQQEICERVFRALTDTGTDARGIRRPTTVASLCALTGASLAEVEEVLKVFRKPSRSFLMPPASEELSIESVVDISHESLMRVWERLKKWAEKEARSARTYRRTAETANLHSAGNTGLIRDQELEALITGWETEKPNADWAKQYPGDWDSVIKLTEESKRAHYQELAEAEFGRRWRKLWRPVLMCVLFVVFMILVVRESQLFADVANGMAVGLGQLFPKGQRHPARIALLILLSFSVTSLLGGYFAVASLGERAYRALQFDKILREVSMRVRQKPVVTVAPDPEAKPVAAPEHYAGFWRRLAAFLVDFVIFIGIFFIAIVICVGPLKMDTEGDAVL